MGLGFDGYTKENLNIINRYKDGDKNKQIVAGLLSRPEQITGGYAHGRIPGKGLGATGSQYTNKLNNKKFFLIKDQNNPVVEGLAAAHENNHATTDQNTSIVQIPERIKNLYSADHNYIGRKNELDASWEEVKHFNRMIDAGYKDNNNSRLRYNLNGLANKFKFYGKEYGETNKDFAREKVWRINEWLEKNKIQ